METAADLAISMLVLVGVALAARSGSELVAAIFSTAPTGVPLSLWLVHRAASSSGSNLSIEAFLTAVVKGAAALAAFALGGLALLKAAGDVPSLGALLGASAHERASERVHEYVREQVFAHVRARVHQIARAHECWYT